MDDKQKSKSYFNRHSNTIIKRENAHAAARTAMDACNLRRNHIESNPDTKVESVNKESLPEWGQFF